MAVNPIYKNGKRTGKFMADAYRKVDGKLKRVRKVFKNKIHAEAWIQNIEQSPASTRTIAELIKHFKNRPRYKRLRESTKKRYEYLLKHFSEWCAARSLDASYFSRDDAQDYEGYCYEKFRGKGVIHALSIVKLLFDEELKRENPSVEKNPFAMIELPKIERKEPRFLTEEELGRLLSVCDEYWYHVFRFLAFTGLRSGELYNLTPQDIQGDEIVIAVKDDWKPKTFKSSRRVPITANARPSVNYLMNLHREGKYLLTGQKKPYRTFIRKKYIELRKLVGLEDTSVHSLRKTYGYLLLKNGASLAGVAALMGHESQSTTERIYVSLLPKDTYAQAQALDKVSIEVSKA